MPNFRIVENTPEEFEKDYRKFINLYKNENVLKRDIPKILGWNQTAYRKARQKAIREGEIEPTPSKSNPKYYSFNKRSGKWLVQKKTKDIVLAHACTSEEEAKALVDYLKRHGWNQRNVYTFEREVWSYANQDR